MDLTSEANAEAEPPFKPLTVQEAQAWAVHNPRISPWRIVTAQAVLGVLCALLGWCGAADINVAGSALYGASVVVLPGAVLAHGLTRRASNPAAAAARFMFWELVKIALAVTLLVVAAKVAPGLSWPALLVTMVVCMKMGWLVLLKRRPSAVTETTSKRV